MIDRKAVIVAIDKSIQHAPHVCREAMIMAREALLVDQEVCVEGAIEFQCGGDAAIDGDGFDITLDERHVADWMQDKQRVSVRIAPIKAGG